MAASLPTAPALPQSAVRRLLPFLDWMQEYRLADLPGDAVAGLVVTFVLVPQAMAYALLAGVPAEYGLYAALLPNLVGGLFSSSRYVSLAPSAMVALMTAGALGAFTNGPPEQYLAAAVSLTMLAGLVHLAMGVLRLGFLVQYFSMPVLKGYLSAAGILIGFSQLRHVFGVSAGAGRNFFAEVPALLLALPQSNPVTLGLSLLCFALLWSYPKLCRELARRGLIPAHATEILAKTGPLAVVGVATLLVVALKLTSRGVVVVGQVPRGLPTLALPGMSPELLALLLPGALAVAFVSYLEVVSVGQDLAARKRQRFEPDQEFFAIGLGNLASAASGGVPVSGGLNRSILSFTAGANTNLAAIFTSGFLALTVLLLTPVFTLLPQASLAVIIVFSSVNLIDVPTLRKVWKYDRLDAAAFIATFLAVLGGGIVLGLEVGVATSILLLLWRLSKPHVAVVGRVGNTEHYRNVLRHQVQTCPNVVAIRIDESLYFANAAFLEAKLTSLCTEQTEVRHLVFICSSINAIDSSALESLRKILQRLRSWGVELHLTEVKGPVMDRLQAAGFIRELGVEHVFLSTHEAMTALGCYSPGRHGEGNSAAERYVEYFI